MSAIQLLMVGVWTTDPSRKEGADRWHRLVAEQFSRMTGRPAADIDEETSAEFELDAEEAVTYGLIDRTVEDLDHP